VLPQIAAAEGRVAAIVVVEKAGGGIDKASVEQRELAAEDALAVVEARAEAAGVPVETDVVYGTDVADAIIDAAGDADATAIAFTPREGGGLLVDLLSGDVARHLVERSDRPVVVFPAEPASENTGDETG
jgi:nucleotide-binding universal stress UspA family protein